MIKQFKKANQMKALERYTAPMPKFFRIIRTVGISLAAACGAILAGAVATAVSQVAVDEDQT